MSISNCISIKKLERKKKMKKIMILFSIIIMLTLNNGGMDNGQHHSNPVNKVAGGGVSTDAVDDPIHPPA
jgi:hypothetical protein